MRPETGLCRLPWQLPDNVNAFVTSRKGGVSDGPWKSFNLGDHVGDNIEHVTENRRRLLNGLQRQMIETPVKIQWLKQVHGIEVHVATGKDAQEVPEADAAYTTRPGIACAVLTADCLPVLFCSRDGEQIAVAHAGWRGLANGVLEATLAHFTDVSQVSVWIGTGIGPCHFEVGREVREIFLDAGHSGDHAQIETAFHATGTGCFMANLYTLARVRLHRAGLNQIAGNPECTVCDPARWYSYRREPVTGRFATLILKTE